MQIYLDLGLMLEQKLMLRKIKVEEIEEDSEEEEAEAEASEEEEAVDAEEDIVMTEEVVFLILKLKK